MTGTQARYAVYFVPRPGSALAAFGDSVLGDWAAMPAFAAGFPAGWRDAPLVYGFHATLKAPFHLAAGTDQASLFDHARDIARSMWPFTVDRLVVEPVDGEFIALVPAGDAPQLDALAANCVRAFEPFRAPLSQADIARRLAVDLTPSERAHLDQYGYPYIFGDFQFHMSLTGRLAAADIGHVRDSLARAYERFDGPVEIDAITICRQPNRSARFEVAERFAFGAA
jgi:Protein of unknown function (DUF1045)